MSPPATALGPPRPEIVGARPAPPDRPRWRELAASADHKDLGRLLIGGALGFLFLAAVLLLLMRLQLAVPENTFLTPQTFSRLLSVYGATAIFLFALPLMVGLFLYLVPLQIGARGTALPRVSQTGFWLWVAGGATLYSSFLWTPPEAGVNPLPPFSELAFIPNNGVDVWLATSGLTTLGLVLVAIDLVVTLRRRRAPGMAWRRVPIFSWAAATCSWLLVITGPVLLAAITMLTIDRNFGGVFFEPGAQGAPLFWQHLSWLFLSAAYVAIVIAAMGAISEIVAALARKPLFNRGAVAGSFVAIAVLGTLAWMQNMYTAPMGIGLSYFAMAMAVLTLVPVGLVLFNWVATLLGGVLRLRAPLLFALGAISTLTIGLAAELGHSLVAVGWQLKDTTDAFAATHYALIGAAVFGGFAALYFWFPKMTGRTMGETLAKLSFWTMLAGVNLALLPLFLAGLTGQPADTYEFYGGEGREGYNLVSTIGFFVLAAGIVLTLANVLASARGGTEAGHDPWGGTTLEWFALSPPPAHNFDVVPDVRGPEPLRDIRTALAERDGAAAPTEARESQPVA